MQKKQLIKTIAIVIILCFCFLGCGKSLDGSSYVSSSMPTSTIQDNNEATAESKDFTWEETEVELSDTNSKVFPLLFYPPSSQEISLSMTVLEISNFDVLYGLYGQPENKSDQPACYLKSIGWYDLSLGKTIFTFEIDADLINWQAIKSSNGFDFTLFTKDQQNGHHYTWYHWEKEQPTPTKLREGNYTPEWPPQLLYYNDDICLFEYEQKQNEIFLVKANQKEVFSKISSQHYLLDMNLSTNGNEILILEATATETNFCILRNGNYIAQRQLASNEKPVFSYMLNDGALLYLQDLSLSTEEPTYKIVWWPLLGEERTFSSEINLSQGSSNQTDRVSFIEFKNSNEAVIHTFIKQNDSILIKNTALPKGFSSSPESIFVQPNENALYIFTQQSQAVLIFANNDKNITNTK